MQNIQHRVKVLIIVGATLFFALVFFFSSTGFYCKVPLQGATEEGSSARGQTVWFVTRGTDFGFVNSADGIAINQGFSPNDGIRVSLDAEFEKLEKKKVLLRFGFSRTLYLMTTGGIDFYSPEEKKTPETPTQAQ